MIALVGSSNWDRVVDSTDRLVGEGPGGGTLNALVPLADSGVETLLVSGTSASDAERLADVHRLAGETALVHVDAIHRVTVRVSDDGDRRFEAAVRSLPLPPLPDALSRASTVDWRGREEWALAYASGLRGACLTSERRAEGLLRAGIRPSTIVDSREHRAVLGEDRLREIGCRWYVSTDGARGGTMWDEERGWGEYRARASTTVDTTGCGDAFRAGILLGLERGRSLSASVGIGVEWSAERAEHWGANRLFVESQPSALGRR